MAKWREDVTPRLTSDETPVSMARLLHELNLAMPRDGILVADGARVVRLGAGEVARFDRPVTAFCTLPDGGLVVALEGKELRVKGGALDGFSSTGPAGAPFHAANAISQLADGRFAVTDGSLQQPCDHWVHDLMGRGAG